MILASFFVSTLSASDWPQFRGPKGNATSYDAQTPVTWDDTKNIAWKTPLPGRGASSAIVYGDRIFLTAYTGYGLDMAKPGDKANLKLHVICLKRATGEVLWDENVEASESTQNFGKRVADHGYATGTPATGAGAGHALTNP